MAKNWTLKEIVKAVVEGGDAYKEMASDAGRRFPISVSMVTGIIAGSNDTAKEFLVSLTESFPDYLTVRKVEKVLKTGIDDVDDSDDDEEEEKKPAKKEKKPAKKSKKVEEDEEEEEDDDEDDDEEEEVKPKKSKKASKKEKKSSKKSKKVEEDDDEDDDDDWDL